MVIVFPFSCQLQLKMLILRMDVKLEKGKVQCVFNPRAPTKLLEREQVGRLVGILVAVRGSKPVGRAAAATCRYLCPAAFTLLREQRHTLLQLQRIPSFVNNLWQLNSMAMIVNNV